MGVPPVFRCDYNVYSTFQSHEPEFDYLKSLEIEEKINKIRWIKKTGMSLFLLTTNGRQCIQHKSFSLFPHFSDTTSFSLYINSRMGSDLLCEISMNIFGQEVFKGRSQVLSG